MTRYQRQMILPEVGSVGQKKLAHSHVLVVGAGGLGCPVLQYLAGAGVGHISLIDPDQVEESNLHRQPLYRMTDLGLPKATAARNHLLAANPELKISTHVQALHPALVHALISDVDVVIDAADSFAVSYMLSDGCFQQKTPLISASALGQAGYVGGFCGTHSPSLRAVFPELPHRGATCASAGVMGPVVGMIGTLQAQMALQVLIGHDPSPLGQLVTLDLKEMRFGGFSFLGATEPTHHTPFVSLDTCNNADHVIDLRSADEAVSEILPSANRATVEEVNTTSIPRTHRIILCCTSGLRAWRAATTLRQSGHENLALLATSACQ